MTDRYRTADSLDEVEHCCCWSEGVWDNEKQQLIVECEDGLASRIASFLNSQERLDDHCKLKKNSIEQKKGK